MKKLYILCLTVCLVGCGSFQFQVSTHNTTPNTSTVVSIYDVYPTYSLGFNRNYRSPFYTYNNFWYNRYYYSDRFLYRNIHYPWNNYWEQYYTWGGFYRSWNYGNFYLSPYNRTPQAKNISYVKTRRSEYRVTPRITTPKRKKSIKRAYNPVKRTHTPRPTNFSPRRTSSNSSMIRGSRGNTNYNSSRSRNHNNASTVRRGNLQKNN